MNQQHVSNRKKKVRKKKNYLLRFCIFVCIIAAIIAFSRSSLFHVKYVTAEGNSYYTDEEVMNIAGAELNSNLLWNIDKGELEGNLLKDPYFVEVRVKRKLPNKLHFQVTERKQIAAIVYGEKYVVIDHDGLILRKSTVDPKVTLLTGLTISKLSVGEKVEAEESTTLETTLGMLSAMEEGDIFFKKIDVSKVIIKAYIYDTLIVKGTPKQMTKAIKNGDLQKVVNNLLKNDTTRGTISLGNHNYMSFSPEF
ncbi:MAG: FtsQ-type POTRA domain-containing protein [Firmicutes bacterium]|nr:FtsQ-type POTRA domain-containing protein [Bacillota bacterium]